MQVRNHGGMTEFIPSPREKREALVRDHVFDLLGNLSGRLKIVEEMLGVSGGDRERFDEIMARLKKEEDEVRGQQGAL